MDNNARQTGAVITFEEGVSPEEAKRLLEFFQEQLRLERITVREYNPSWGEPVFYVP